MVLLEILLKNLLVQYVGPPFLTLYNALKISERDKSKNIDTMLIFLFLFKINVLKLNLLGVLKRKKK